MNVPLLSADHPKAPFNISGRWKIGPNEFLGIRHWRFLANAVWSTREYSSGEELVGLLKLENGKWVLTAYFGSSMSHEGYVSNDGGTLSIQWPNGSEWTRVERRGPWPKRSLSGIDSVWKYLRALPCRLRPVAAALMMLCCALFVLALRYCWEGMRQIQLNNALSAMGKFFHIFEEICLLLDTVMLLILIIWWRSIPTGPKNTGDCVQDICTACINGLLRAYFLCMISICTIVWVVLFLLLSYSWAVALYLVAFAVISVALVFLAKWCWSCCRNPRVKATLKSAINTDSPSKWPDVLELSHDDPEFMQVSKTFEQRCRPWLHMYPFALSLDRVYKVINPELQTKFDGASSGLDPQYRSNVQALFHGSNTRAIRSIIQGGFRLPTIAGMFGKGIYFADTPLKSWQYSTRTQGNLLLLCDVALGNEKKVKHAVSSFDPKRDFRPGFLQEMLGHSPYNSVVALPRCQGGAVNVPEYVVYTEAQTMPRYILQCKESRDSRR
eukprot:TRINITY_DN189_c0_g5_i1.p1 TRINITY_DN189_c0_g5~~TRINITY_DN189_c0_g5_i1.p1  ORF type:complete len:512 (-),score=36.99 TRINITY_DN189_c0_g5_i1:221-1711(-)